jgi:dihydrolipoyl dehydrogenase
MLKADLTVIGAGPGGYVGALRGAACGLKTILVEKDDRLGGTCLLRGCIPTKAMIQSAQTWQLCSKDARTFGIKVADASFDWSAVQKRKDMVVKKGSMGISMLMEKAGVQIVNGHGRLDGAGRVVVGDQTIESDKIILATGSTVACLPGIEFDGQRILSSDHLLEIDEVPQSLVVLGAGAVGTEFADVFASFGCKVTLVEMLPGILPLEDPDCGVELAKALKRRKVDIRTGTRAGKVDLTETGVSVELIAEGADPVTIEAEKLLVATGRKPHTKDLGLDSIDCVVDGKGFIQTDAFMQTAQAGVYAIGDIVATPQLAHTASAEALLAVAHLTGGEAVPIDYDLNPNCTYTSPEVASVGLSEPEARNRGFEVKTATFPMSAVLKASIINELHGFIKVVADADSMKVLGVHMVGAHATDLIAEACVAMASGLDAHAWSRVIHPHPTICEATADALHSLLGEAVHG